MKRKPVRVRAVIFDMDDVITHTMHFHVRAVKKALKKEKIEPSAHEVYLREGKPAPDLFREFLDLHRKKYTDETIERMVAVKDATFKKIFRKKFIRGSRAFVKRLGKEGIDAALVTGSSAEDLERILPEKVRKRFKVIVSSDDVEEGKPSSEGYCKALEKLGISAGEAFVIENAPLGIEAAKNAGLRCAALTTTLKKKYLKQADYVFSSYKQLTKKLAFEPPAHEAGAELRNIFAGAA